jgi:2-alkenal reductase
MVIAVLALASIACSTSALAQPLAVDSANSTPAVDIPVADVTSQPVVIPTIPPELIAQAGAQEAMLIGIYQRVSPAVINVDVAAAAQPDAPVTDFGSGSGFVIDTDGHIVTNRHVIADAQEVRVTFGDGRVFPATVVGSDEFSDLAVLKIDVPADYTLFPVELGDSDNLLVGQSVVVIGNPFGLTGSMSVGIISALGRTLPSAVVTSTGVFSNPRIIQTDAAINPGNSGGPLLDSNGKVIGVAAAIRSTSGANMGVGFAIPVNTVKRIVPQIIETGKVEYPYLGISAQTAFPMSEVAAAFDLPVNDGILIATVSAGAAAADAGLKGADHQEQLHGQDVGLGGDIITAIDGVPLHTFDDLLGYLVSNTSVGQTVVLTIVRDGETMDVDVVLGPRPSNN